MLVIFKTSGTENQTEISLLFNCNDDEDAGQTALDSTKGCVNDNGVHKQVLFHI